VNRYFRRLRRFGKRFSESRSQGEMLDTSERLIAPATPQDVKSPRAKSSGHGKTTADKWNQ
jgi:hypothetical protein